MGTGVAADDVPAAMKLAQLRFGQKSGGADPIGGDEEMTTPAAALEQIRDRMMKARAAVVKGEQHGAAFELIHRANGGSGAGDGLEVVLEILAAQFVDVGAFAGKTAGLEVAVFHNIVVHDGKRLHGVSSY